MISSAQPLANATQSSTGIRHQVSVSADGTTSTPMPRARPARYSPSPGRPISAASPSPPSRSGRQRNRPSPMRAGPTPLRHNRYSPSAPQAIS